jgi:hypothetical protein
MNGRLANNRAGQALVMSVFSGKRAMPTFLACNQTLPREQIQ